MGRWKLHLEPVELHLAQEELHLGALALLLVVLEAAGGATHSARRKKSLHKQLARAALAMLKTVHTTMICGRSFCTLVFHCWRSLMTSDAQRQRSCARQLRATFEVVPIPTTHKYCTHHTSHTSHLIEYVSLI